MSRKHALEIFRGRKKSGVRREQDFLSSRILAGRVYEDGFRVSTEKEDQMSLYQKGRWGESLRKQGGVPILFGMDIAIAYSVIKPLRRIDAL
jgi:hypothetical protein